MHCSDKNELSRKSGVEDTKMRERNVVMTRADASENRWHAPRQLTVMNSAPDCSAVLALGP
jgi:hypothetical protein